MHGATLLIAHIDPRASSLLRALRALEGVDFVCADKKVTARNLAGLIARAEESNQKGSVTRRATIADAKARGVFRTLNNLKNQDIGGERGRATKTRLARARAHALAPQIAALRSELRASGQSETLWSLVHALNSREIKTPEGKLWTHPMQVARILSRIGDPVPEREGDGRGRPKGSKSKSEGGNSRGTSTASAGIGVILWVFLTLFSASSARADCLSVKDYDKRQACLAEQHQEPAGCIGIRDSDSRELCRLRAGQRDPWGQSRSNPQGPLSNPPRY